MEVINILYEGVDISDVDIEGFTSTGCDSVDESLLFSVTKRENLRRYLLRFMAILFGMLTLSALAISLDMYLNDPKIMISKMDVEILFADSEDIAITSVVKSDYLVKHGSQRYLITDAKCTIQYDDDDDGESFGSFHLYQSGVNENMYTDFEISRYHVVRDIAADVKAMWTGSRSVSKSLMV